MITIKKFGDTSQCKSVDEIILENKSGLKMSVLNYGGVIKNIWVPSQMGEKDIVLGFNTLEEYEMNVAYFGALVGRVAGRIGGGSFELDSQKVILVKNDRLNNHLHGGVKGLSKTLFSYEKEENEEECKITLKYFSPENEDHYPGSVDYKICYTLTKNSRIILEYLATPSCNTPISLTQHSYFNLNGENSKKTHYNHNLYIDSDAVVELDDLSIPTGKLISQKGGFFDVSSEINIGEHFNKFRDSMPMTQGFDHPFVLGNSRSAMLTCCESGIRLDVETSEPILVCYSGNMLEYQIGKSGYEYTNHMAICLETQQYPNAVNISHFPSTIYSPDNPYKQRTEWKISF